MLIYTKHLPYKRTNKPTMPECNLWKNVSSLKDVAMATTALRVASHIDIQLLKDIAA